MAITKTNFINYSRCPRYVALEKVKKERLAADVSYQEYCEEEKVLKLQEILLKMYDEEDGEEVDLIDVENPQLEVMLPYYNQVEMLAGKKIAKMFSGQTYYDENTFAQKKFSFVENDCNYLCYVDICNYNNDNVNIFEVKAATTSSFWKDYVAGIEKEKFPLFHEEKGIYYFKDEISGYDITSEMKMDDYFKKRNKLLDRFDKMGRHIYDLAIQRMILENSGHKNGKYYLALLNHQYIFDGKMENGVPVYKDDIVCIFDMTKITKEWQERILSDKQQIEKFLNKMDAKPYKLGCYCENKKNTKCKFVNVCFSHIPKKYSVFTYMNNGHGFKLENGVKYKALDLVNQGKVNFLDVPQHWLKNRNHLIQRKSIETKKTYLNPSKIKDSLVQLQYPLYYLDFETFPCPLPRFKGEKCYEQSPFQFSVHVEKKPGSCDERKNHYEFLANSFNDDQRHELTKKLCEVIDLSGGGMIIAQNVAFEKRAIKLLMNCFPQYQKKLQLMLNNNYDLLHIVRNKKELYLELGYNDADSKSVNYYHHDLDGSYSIKKTLAVLTDLSYQNLDIQDGINALVTYANFDKLSKQEFAEKYNALKDYCRLDTYGMVLILDELRHLSNKAIDNKKYFDKI